MSDYQMNLENDMINETTKYAFSHLIKSPHFLKMMYDYITENELAPNKEMIDLCIDTYNNIIIPEVESLIRVIGKE